MTRYVKVMDIAVISRQLCDVRDSTVTRYVKVTDIAVISHQDSTVTRYVS